MTTLNPSQHAALVHFHSFLAQPAEPVFLLRGYAGADKTFLLKTLLFNLVAQGRRVLLLAPTGRTARVMAHSAGQNDATTIHRAIYNFRQIKPLHKGKTDAEKSFRVYFSLAANLLATAEETAYGDLPWQAVVLQYIGDEQPDKPALVRLVTIDEEARSLSVPLKKYRWLGKLPVGTPLQVKCELVAGRLKVILLKATSWYALGRGSRADSRGYECIA